MPEDITPRALIVYRPEDPPRRRIRDLAARCNGHLLNEDSDVELTGITLSTGDLRPGGVFVGIAGARRHGADLAQEAVGKGAVAIMTDEEGAAIAASAGVPVIVVDDPRGCVAEAAPWVYGTDTTCPAVLGVTGTNGKTSTVHLQQALLRQLGVSAGVSSSARRQLDEEFVVAGLTTPEAPELHAFLARAAEQRVRAVSLEVSAQALIRRRVEGVLCEVAAFTNLQYDHFDDFDDFDEYLAAKLPLFRSDRARRAVVSLDTPAGSTVVEHADIPVTTIATPEIAEDAALAGTAEWTVRMIDEGINATTFELTGPQDRRLVATAPVTGPHMAANAGLAIVMILEAGLATWADVKSVLERDGIRTELPGRTELVTTGRGPVVYLDFAHTPDGFEMTAGAVRRQTAGRLVIVFGADGSRDTTKRPAMGRAAARYSDAAIVTDHHPRWEDAAVIRSGLYEGAAESPPPGGLYNISPPEDAIMKAVALAGEGDAVLWFGPGHQDHREIMGVRTPYDPRGIALRALRAAGW